MLTCNYMQINQLQQQELTTERGGFEPPVPEGTTLFESAAFILSAIPPKLYITEERGFEPLRPLRA